MELKGLGEKNGTYWEPKEGESGPTYLQIYTKQHLKLSNYIEKSIKTYHKLG